MGAFLIFFLLFFFFPSLFLILDNFYLFQVHWIFYNRFAIVLYGISEISYLFIYYENIEFTLLNIVKVTALQYLSTLRQHLGNFGIVYIDFVFS